MSDLQMVLWYALEMPLMRNKKPIDLAFNHWIRSYPESYHPMDMDRFYVLVKTVVAYSRSKETRSADWLRKRIASVPNRLSEEDIENYCDKFMTLQDYDRATHIPLYVY